MPPKYQVGGEPFEPVELTAGARRGGRWRTPLLLLIGALVVLYAITKGRRGRG